MADAFAPLTFPCGRTVKNRLFLAPMTNLQSHADGTLSEAEIHWLSMRSQGGFAVTMTAAAHVQANGQGFPGQLGIFSDAQLPGLTRLARQIKADGSVAMIQLYHAGMRAHRPSLGGLDPVAPSPHEQSGSRELTTVEVEQVIEDFIQAAQRARAAGFEGVEIHGAHSYLLGQFLSADFNRRSDGFGGSLENRSRALLAVLDGIRRRCGAEFLIGVRLTPERHGIQLMDAVATFKLLIATGQLDYIDMSLWDIYKEPEDEAYRGRSLMAYFTELERGAVRLSVAGHIYEAADVQHCLAHNVDFVKLGRAAILHHDFPRRMAADVGFAMQALPVSRDYLYNEGLAAPFVDYLSGAWKGFVTES